MNANWGDLLPLFLPILPLLYILIVLKTLTWIGRRRSPRKIQTDGEVVRERVFILEIASPFQWRPGRFKSRIVRRYWWGWVAVTRLRISLVEFVKNEWDWIGESR